MSSVHHSITTTQSSRACWTITFRSTRSSLNVPSVLKPQAVPSRDIALFGQCNVHHLEVSTICRAECSSRNVARVGSIELSIPFQSALYSASPVFCGPSPGCHYWLCTASIMRYFCGCFFRSDLTVGFALWDPAEPLNPPVGI